MASSRYFRLCEKKILTLRHTWIWMCTTSSIYDAEDSSSIPSANEVLIWIAADLLSMSSCRDTVCHSHLNWPECLSVKILKTLKLQETLFEFLLSGISNHKPHVCLGDKSSMQIVLSRSACCFEIFFLHLILLLGLLI